MQLRETASPQFGMAVWRPVFPPGTTQPQRIQAISRFANTGAPRLYRGETWNPLRKLARWLKPERAITIPATVAAQNDLVRQQHRNCGMIFDFSKILLIYGPQDKALATEVESLRSSSNPGHKVTLAIRERELAAKVRDLDMTPYVTSA